MALTKLASTPKKYIEFPAKITFSQKTHKSPKRPKCKYNKERVQGPHIQQRYLKQHFSNTTRRQDQPPSQRVWRRTIVRIKTKPKARLPRLFRTDHRTGLPLDYERTVSKIMHYVNPHLSSSPNPEHQMKELLTRTLAGIMGSCNCNNRCPQRIRQHVRSILRGQETQGTKKDKRTDAYLSDFHSACKRGPVMPEPLAPTYKSKFNYNNLKIMS